MCIFAGNANQQAEPRDAEQTMERRRDKRISVSLKAALLNDKTLPRGCRVRDFSPRGMLLQYEYDGNAASFDDGDTVTVRLSLRQADEQQQEELRRELKRLREQQQQMLRDMDELQQRMDQPENRQRMAEANQQLDQTRQNMQQGAEEM